MALKDEVIQQCTAIRDETQKNANTAERVGTAMLGIVQLAEEKAAKEDVAEKVLLISKNGLNGEISPTIFSYPKKIKVLNVKCASNCNNFTLKIGATTYDKTSIVGVEIPAETEVQIIDVNILAGMNAGNIRIIFKEL